MSRSDWKSFGRAEALSKPERWGEASAPLIAPPAAHWDAHFSGEVGPLPTPLPIFGPCAR
ncbi:MAG: hypothetical protein ABR517_03710 [Thermoanaerobaculia bacterium]